VGGLDGLKVGKFVGGFVGGGDGGLVGFRFAACTVVAIFVAKNNMKPAKGKVTRFIYAAKRNDSMVRRLTRLTAV
jgi:hypothetical protein